MTLRTNENSGPLSASRDYGVCARAVSIVASDAACLPIIDWLIASSWLSSKELLRASLSAARNYCLAQCSSPAR